jgi:hypothetical protein
MGRGARQRCFDDVEFEVAVLNWLRTFDEWGYCGDPAEWANDGAISAFLATGTLRDIATES